MRIQKKYDKSMDKDLKDIIDKLDGKYQSYPIFRKKLIEKYPNNI